MPLFETNAGEHQPEEAASGDGSPQRIPRRTSSASRRTIHSESMARLSKAHLESLRLIDEFVLRYLGARGQSTFDCSVDRDRIAPQTLWRRRPGLEPDRSCKYAAPAVRDDDKRRSTASIVGSPLTVVRLLRATKLMSSPLRDEARRVQPFHIESGEP